MFCPLWSRKHNSLQTYSIDLVFFLFCLVSLEEPGNKVWTGDSNFRSLAALSKSDLKAAYFDGPVCWPGKESRVQTVYVWILWSWTVQSAKKTRHESANNPVLHTHFHTSVFSVFQVAMVRSQPTRRNRVLSQEGREALTLRLQAKSIDGELPYGTYKTLG